ncbi:MAG: hypothetical protein ACXU9I_05750, partial [Syntrophales bacterium]
MGVPPNPYNADLHYFMGNMRYLPKLALQRAGNESSGTLKGTAVMVVRHTQSSFTGLAIN